MFPTGIVVKAGAASALLLVGILAAPKNHPLLAVGIGGTGSAALHLIADKADVCASIDDAMAAQALNGPVTRDTNLQSSLPGLCTWRSKGTPGDGLTVQVDAGGQDKYDFDRSKLPVRDLHDVGDEAFAFASPAGFVQLGMMKGGVYVTMVLQLQNGQDRLERAVALAQAIAARM